MSEKTNVFPNEVYKHFKGGLYTVLFAGTDFDTMKNKIIYQSNESNVIWIRDYEEFVGYKNIDGKSVKRFEYQGTVNIEQFFYKEENNETNR